MAAFRDLQSRSQRSVIIYFQTQLVRSSHISPAKDIHPNTRRLILLSFFLSCSRNIPGKLVIGRMNNLPFSEELNA